MKVIGLCGGSGSGKGTVASIFAKLGIPAIDTDAVYHTLTSEKSPCLDALVEQFGDGILASNGSLDRKKLTEIVFYGDNSEINRQILNKIAHKHVLDKTRELISEYRKEGKHAAIVDAPLLFESGFDKECDIVIAVTASENTRLERITKRDKISFEKAKLRIRAQLPDEYLAANSKYTVKNEGNLSDLTAAVETIAEEILNS